MTRSRPALERLEDRRLLTAFLVGDSGPMREVGSDPTLEFSATVPAAVTHTTVGWSGAVDPGAIHHGHGGVPGAADDDLIEGSLSYTSTVKGVRTETLTADWVRHDFDPAYTVYVEGVPTFTTHPDLAANSGTRGGGLMKFDGGGEATATFKGVNFVPDAPADDAAYYPGVISMYVGIYGHTANLEVLAVRDLPDAGGSEATPGALYAGEEVEVDVRVLDDWGDPVSTTVTPVGGSYDDDVVAPSSAGTGGDGVATLKVKLERPGDAGFEVETAKGGQATVNLAAMADSLVINPTSVSVNAASGWAGTVWVDTAAAGVAAPNIKVTDVRTGPGTNNVMSLFTFNTAGTSPTQGRQLTATYNGTKPVGGATFTFVVTVEPADDETTIQGSATYTIYVTS